MINHITYCFHNLFTTSNIGGSMHYIDGIEGRITTRMNEALNRNFIADEVSNVLKQMHPTKALGPDGMPPIL